MDSGYNHISLWTRLITVFALTVCGCYSHSMSGEIREVHITDSATIRFHQGKSYLDSALDHNAEILDSLTREINTLSADSTLYRLSRVNVVGAASPEGSVKINNDLSHRRADRIFDYISANTPLTDSIATFTFIGRDWHGLLALAAQDPQLPYRTETIALLSEIAASTAHGESADSDNLLRIQTLRGGEPYRYMYANYFPSLRESSIFVEYTRLLTPVADNTPAIDINVIPEVYPGVFTRHTQQPGRKPFYMAVKTNMLYDALAIPNIGLEFYLGKNLSLYGNWMYAWWSNDARHRYWRIYGGDLTLRYWFGSAAHRKPLTGHHIGVYGGVVTYDFEFGGRGYMGGIPGGAIWDRCMYVAGVEYGYSLPVSRRLNIDFTIGLGYCGGKTVEYEPDNKFYIWEKTRRTHWVGPTRAEISLVWLIGRGNYNSKKGGDI